MLTLLWALPAVGALCAVFGGKRAQLVAPVAAGVALLLGFVLWPSANTVFTSVPWIGVIGVRYALGLSGLSLLLVLLTLLLTVIAGIVGGGRGPAFVAWVNTLGAAAVGLFLARDLVLFYLFWEAMLVPTYFLLVGWGGSGRRAAAWKFLLYNLGGSLFLLLSIAALIAFRAQMPVAGGPTAYLTGSATNWIALGLLVAFAVKTPLWPLHGWVADTYAELPAPAAALVAGVQSKAGLYGMLVILLPLLPKAASNLAPLIITLGIVSVLYGGLTALRSQDPRRLLARSSISHLGLIAVAIMSLRSAALDGAVIQMVSHGLFTAGLFLALGMLELRLSAGVTLGSARGLYRKLPIWGGAFLLLGMAALGLPGLGGFPGELLMVVGIYHHSPLVAILAGVGLVLAAATMLRLIQLLLHGPEEDQQTLRDLSRVERWALAPVLALLVVIGLWPNFLVSTGQGTVTSALGPVNAASAPIYRNGPLPGAPFRRPRGGWGAFAIQLSVQKGSGQ